MSLTGNTVYYPLTIGNRWTYRMKDGNTYTNSLTDVDSSNPTQFTLFNTFMNKNYTLRKEDDAYYTDAFEPDNFQMSLKDNVNLGDRWEIKFTANGIQSLMLMTVKEVGATKTVEGRTYHDVLLLEADSKFVMNGNVLPMNFYTYFHYAKGIGLILTTTSTGDVHALIDYQV